MQITRARVASIHYTLTDDAGQVIDSSREAEPLRYFHGAGNLIPGLEDALLGKQAGDRLVVDVQPENAYGVRDDGLIQTLPRDVFKGIDSIVPGMQFQAQGGQGPLLVTVVSVQDDSITIDGNHPLAGQTLHFDVEVLDVREATEAEQQAGRVVA